MAAAPTERRARLRGNHGLQAGGLRANRKQAASDCCFTAVQLLSDCCWTFHHRLSEHCLAVRFFSLLLAACWLPVVLFCLLFWLLSGCSGHMLRLRLCLRLSLILFFIFSLSLWQMEG